jgi:geranylgeranyl pyrophosphate synthase
MFHAAILAACRSRRCYTRAVELEQFNAEWQPRIRKRLDAQLGRVAVPELAAAMRHLVGRGKLFRPLLALAAYAGCGGDDADSCLSLVTPLELIHTFTLIHDDLPCMDDAALRRGVPSVHVAHGEATAVLAGDALLNLALYLLATEAAPVSPEVRLLLIRSATRATEAVVEGQVLDLQGEGRQLTVEQQEHMNRLKTGALIGACCETGALLAGDSPDAVHQLRDWGELVGLAFQVRDDLLSVEGTEQALGKTITTDVDKHKATWVSALGAAGAHAYLSDLGEQVEGELARMQLPQPGLLRAIARQAARREH